MIRRIALALLMVGLMSSCTDRLGRGVPECDALIRNSAVLQMQAVPDAAYVPCIESLPVGWTYNHVEAQSGQSEFTLDSDRMGDEFVLVRTSVTCDIGGTREQPSPFEGMRLYSDVEANLTVPIVFVAEGPTDATIDAAQSIVTGLVGETIDGNKVDVTIDRTEGPTADRIDEALDDGANVLVIGLRDAEEGTATLVLAGQADELTVPVAEALDMIEDSVSPPSIRGSWFHVFEGGCIEYRFDAVGSETHTLEQRIRNSLGFTDAAAVREIARSDGYDI